MTPITKDLYKRQDYTFTMVGKADELVGSVANGDLDIVLVPAISEGSS